jgi:murein DD-endopeptidase MepM/ murein hydrolase activator NlpD
MKSRILTLLTVVFFINTGLPSLVNAETIAKLSSTVVFPLLAPKLSSSYGRRNHPIFKVAKHHSGLDLAAPEQSHVRSILDGTVIYSGTLPGYGKVVSVKHSDNHISLYGHLSQISVEIGKDIVAGTVIGRVGHTGHATGPHLHFEWRKDGKPLDPLTVFPEIAADPLG